MTHVNPLFVYHPLLFARGVPYRLNKGRTFDLGKSLSSVMISETQIVPGNKQRRMFDAACKGDTGWLMFLCATGPVEKCKHLAATICEHYQEREIPFQWLSSFDKLDKIEFRKLRLVVIDTLFHDSSNFRRDRIYEVINHHCNVRDMSVVVIGQHSSPLMMAEQLGTRPDLFMQVK